MCPAVLKKFFITFGEALRWLHIDMTEDSFRDFLTDAGLVNPYCKKLYPMENQKFQYSCFYGYL